VNADGILSPRDALCAYEIYLHLGTVLPDCDFPGDCEIIASDVNCNGVVSPGDALKIFERYLALGAPAGCFAKTSSATMAVDPNGAPFDVPVAQLIDIGNGLVSVPVMMMAAEGAAAFGFELRYDPEMFEFDRFLKDPAAGNWKAVGANRVEPGRIIVGGFDTEGLATDDVARGIESNGTVKIAELRFRKLNDAATLEPVIWKCQLLEPRHEKSEDGPQRVTKLDLGKAFPNPVRDGVSAFVSIPDNETHRVTVSIYDVQGRLVRTILDRPVNGGQHTVEWDRRATSGEMVSSGIYFMRMAVRGAEFVRTRKLVVLK
jgi:hypothetical protein